MERSAGKVRAQRVQRCTGCAKRATQGSHTWRAGQLRQTAHWLAMPEAKPGERGRNAAGASRRVNTVSIYSRTFQQIALSFFFSPHDPHRAPAHARPDCRRRWERTAPLASPWLHEEVARRMMDRLQWIKLQPRSWVHWGALRGGLLAHAQLAKTYPGATAFVLETGRRRAQEPPEK
jgi:hypothetical protein